MKRYISYFTSFIILLFLAACSSDHFLKETDYRAKVEDDFAKKQEVLTKGNLFAVFDNSTMTQTEREAMMFLYAYMSPGDITDYSGDFYLNNVRLALQTRENTSWGKTIPDLIFRHFVLPVRVNNENLDNAREVFHNELMPRIKNLSAHDAVLEVNHWCHEKVVYTPSDSRTSAPLASVKTAYGRCGEESTFLVAALRSVGIPARQVYTPRWAHTDDNHAWVEAWVDGKWFFLGACEPEPVLNLGWFNAPASRGMLMHTKVFGAYNGPEDVMKQTANYTEINIIDNYGKSSLLEVLVKDANNHPVQGADVEFKIYNYAEFYTVARKTTDENGHASLSAGIGDMLVYASQNGKFGFQKASFGKEKQITVILDHQPGENFSLPFNIVPPEEKVNMPEVTEEQRAENTRRMNLEDSIRNAYVNGFPTAEKAEAFAKELNLNSKQTTEFILKSRGNYADIMQFLKNAVQKEMGARALELLSTVSDKDLRDTPCAILEDHLYHTDAKASCTEVLAPRVAAEMLTPYRSYLQKNIPADLAEKFIQSPQTLVNWCKDSLLIRDDLNTRFTKMSPEGVWRCRVTDTGSREIFFVAAARSLGIPAWKDEVNGNVYYRQNNEPVKVDFEAAISSKPSEGYLQASYQPIPRLNNPKYYSHFTLSKFNNGTFQLQNYPEGNTTWESLLKKGTKIETGYYMLVSGNRLANGSVLSNISFFNVEEGKTSDVQLKMRDNTEEIRVIGNFDSEAKFTLAQTKEETSVLATTGRGYYIVGVLGVGQEPTNHALKDIEIKKDEFEKWGRTLLLLFTDEAAYRKFNRKDFPNLPSTVVFGIDTDGKIRKMIADNMKLANGGQLPVFIIGDTFNRVVFESHGYTIGLGEQMIHLIHGL